MWKCEHCASANVQWFTPTRAATQAAVLLCMSCHRLTIVPPRTQQSRELAPLRLAA